MAKWTPMRAAFALFAAMATAPLAQPAGAQSLLPGFGWSGGYVGIAGGGAFADVKSAKKAGDLVWTAYVGQGLRIANFYVGGEVDATWGGAKSSYYISPLYSSTAEADWSATARARAGLVAGGALIYLTGGVAWSAQSVGVYTLGREVAGSTKVLTGAVFGAGVELKLLPFATARVEALRYDFAQQGKSFAEVLQGTSWKTLDLDQTVIRAGINLRLN